MNWSSNRQGPTRRLAGSTSFKPIVWCYQFIYTVIYIPKILRTFYLSNNRLLYRVLCTAHFHAAVWIISGSNLVLMIHLTDSLLPSITHCSIECRYIQAGITNKLATLLLHLGYQWLLISTLRFFHKDNLQCPNFKGNEAKICWSYDMDQ